MKKILNFLSAFFSILGFSFSLVFLLSEKTKGDNEILFLLLGITASCFSFMESLKMGEVIFFRFVSTIIFCIFFSLFFVSKINYNLMSKEILYLLLLAGILKITHTTVCLISKFIDFYNKKPSW